MRNLFVILIILLFSNNQILKSEIKIPNIFKKNEIFFKNSDVILFKVKTKDQQKDKSYIEYFISNAQEHCKSYNKNYYLFLFFSKRADQWVGDAQYDNKYSIFRFICANNVPEAKNIIKTIKIKNFKSLIEHEKEISLLKDDEIFLTKDFTSDVTFLNNQKKAEENFNKKTQKDISRDEIVKKYFPEISKLSSLEGIWLRESKDEKRSNESGTIIYIYKENDKYFSRYFKSVYSEKGALESEINKISDSYYLAKPFHPTTGVIMGEVIIEKLQEGKFKETFKSNTTNKELITYIERLYPEKSNNNKIISNNDTKPIPAASGTGFFISSSGYIVTNYHVIDGCDFVKVNFNNDQLNTKVISSDKTNDLAIIQANVTPKSIFPISDEDVQLLEDIIIAGYPLGKKVSDAIKTSKGSVTALAGYNDNYSEFQTDAALNKGNSGGPIMNQKGNVVGVAVAAFGKKEGVESFNFGIKSSTLRTFAKANGINFLPPNRRELSNKELGQLITNGTVYLECHMTVAKIKQMMSEANNRKAFFTIN